LADAKLNYTAGQRRHVEGWIAYVKDGGVAQAATLAQTAWCFITPPDSRAYLYRRANTICKGRKMDKGLATGGISILRVRSSRFSVLF
jgi:hypothetical protein